MTMHDMTKRDARCALTWYEVVPVKGGNIRENIPSVSHFRTDEPEGESCVLAMLGMCGERTGYVSGFVSLFWATFMYKVFPSELQFILYDFLKVLLISGFSGLILILKCKRKRATCTRSSTHNSEPKADSSPSWLPSQQSTLDVD